MKKTIFVLMVLVVAVALAGPENWTAGSPCPSPLLDHWYSLNVSTNVPTDQSLWVKFAGSPWAISYWNITNAQPTRAALNTLWSNDWETIRVDVYGDEATTEYSRDENDKAIIKLLNKRLTLLRTVYNASGISNISATEIEAQIQKQKENQ